MTYADGQTVVLAEHKWVTETLTAEYHPDDHGMKFMIRIVGGKYHGTEIHCPTAVSVERMFDALVACRQRNIEHHALMAV